jgi:hypothetical protein
MNEFLIYMNNLCREAGAKMGLYLISEGISPDDVWEHLPDLVEAYIAEKGGF